MREGIPDIGNGVDETLDGELLFLEKLK